MLPPLLCLSLLKAPDLTAHLRPLASILTDLSKEAGETVELSPKLSRHAVLLERGDSPPQVALEAIAKSIYATLVRTKTGYRIERTPDDERRNADQVAADHLRWLRTATDYNDKLRERRRTSDDPSGSMSREIRNVEAILDPAADPGFVQSSDADVSALLPERWLLQSIVARIGLEKIAALPTGEVAVYEDPAVDTAKRLPTWKDLAAEYRSRCQRLEGTRLEAEWKEKIGPLSAQNPFANWSDRFREIWKLRLEVRASAIGMTLQLEGFDRAGKRLLNAFVLAGETPHYMQLSWVLKDPKAKVNAKFVPLSDDAVKSLDFLGAPKKADLPNWFSRPDLEEPLDPMLGGVLEGLADHHDHRCLAMDVPDGFLGVVRLATTGRQVNLKVLQKLLEVNFPYVRLEDAKSVVWRPAPTNAGELTQSDRPALRRFFLRTTSRSRIDLRDRAKLFFEASPRRSTMTPYWSRGISGILPRRETNDFISEGLYRILGQVSDSQWSRLIQGQGLTARELSITDSLTRLLEQDQNLPIMGKSNLPDLYRHPLEMFENASVAEATVRLVAMRTAVETVWDEGQEEPSAGAPRGSFQNAPGPLPFFFHEGQYQTSVTREAFDAAMDHHRFRFGTRPDYRVIVDLPHGYAVVAEYQGANEMEAEAIPYTRLPVEVRDATWKSAYEEGLRIAKQRQNGAGAAGTNREP